MDKVQGGTPKSAETLCKTCANSVYIKGFGTQEVVHCNAVMRSITFEVQQCSYYRSRSATDLKEMQKIAWIVETRNRGKWGFVDGQAKPELEVVVRPPRPKTEYEPPVVGE